MQRKGKAQHCLRQSKIEAQSRKRLSAWTSLAGERMALNIFEPRYRLMVRRCMEGNRRFGMAVMDHSHVLHGVACEAEIVECQPQPDGYATHPWPPFPAERLPHGAEAKSGPL